MSLPWTVPMMVAAAATAGEQQGPKREASGKRVRVESEQPQTPVITAPPADGSDLALLRSAAGGDRAAFHALVDRHSPGLFRLARSLARNRADAEDVVQETFIGAFRGLKNFDGRASVKTWLSRICVRQAARHWHGSRRSREALTIDSADGPAAGPAAADPALSTTSSVPNADRRMDLNAVIETLPEDHRQVIVLREVRGLSYDEIAAVLSVPRGTVESRLHRARAALRQKLNGYDR